MGGGRSILPHMYVCVCPADMQPLVLEVGLGRVPVASMCVGKATVANIKDLVSQESVEG